MQFKKIYILILDLRSYTNMLSNPSEAEIKRKMKFDIPPTTDIEY